MRIGFAASDTAPLARLPGHVPRHGSQDATTPNAEAGKNDDAQDHGDPNAYTTGEIKKNAYVHRASVNLIAWMRNVTLVSSVVQGSALSKLVGACRVRRTHGFAK